MRQVGKLFVLCTVLVVCVGAIAYVGIDVMGRAMKMEPASIGAVGYDSAKAGTPIKVIIRIDAKDGSNAVSGRLLTAVSETEYRTTAATIHARIEPSVRFIMGSFGDLKPGGIAQFDGARDAEGTLHVRRIVILSSYVHVVAS